MNTTPIASNASEKPVRKRVWPVVIGIALISTIALGWRLYGTTLSVSSIRRVGGTLFARRSDGKPVWNKRNPYLQSTTPTSAVIVWQTTEPASTLMEYRLEKPNQKWQKATANAKKVRQHIVKLTGLTAASIYRYRAGSNGRQTFEGLFQTDKRAGQPFSFAAWGDSGVGGDGQKQLASQIDKQKPDFLVHTGDLIYPRGQWKGFDPYFFDMYAKTLARVPFYGSLGNHDVLTQKGQPFLENFVLPRNGPGGLMPERNYSFDYADAHFVVIDSNLKADELQQNVVPWLQRNVRQSKAKWKFAVLHHPPFSSGAHGDEKRIRQVLVPVFSQLKIDVVLNGHDHAYERFHPQDGVTYIVTGAGGAEYYPRRKVRAMTASFNNQKWSFTRIDVTPNGRQSTLRGRQIAYDGTILDEWRLQK